MRFIVLYVAFFLSGAAALVYEAAWARYLGLLVGHDAYAQVIVLVIFLGGMSAGAAFIARHTNRFRNPLLGYAIVEAVVGLLALGFHGTFQFISGLAYDTLFPALAGSAALGPIKWLLAALLILPQSVLLGSTFPLMSAGIVRHRMSEPGRILSWLYFTNSLGGAVGVLLAGFVLVRTAGLPGTLAAAGALNLIVALMAFFAGRIPVASLHSIPSTTEPVSSAPEGESISGRLLLGITFGTAVASFIYEIDWIRMLSLVLGSATHSFELMLSAFILGLAIGALCITRLDSLRAPVRTLAFVQIAMGVLAILTLPVYVASFDWMVVLLQTFTRTDAGYAGFSIVRYGLCLAVMLPATICAGMTLPLITRSLMVRGGGEAAIGRVYAWNTLGSIVGVSLGALVLLPAMGLKPMLLAAGAIDVALGIVILTTVGSVRRAATIAVVATSLIGLVALTVPLEKRLLTSGVYRRGTVAPESAFTIPYYMDGRTATVAVGLSPSGSRWISTNGKPDASLGPWWNTPCTETTSRIGISGDDVTQVLLPLVTQAYRPDARQAVIIGFGSGMSSHVMLAQPSLQELTTIEIEPEMVTGSRLFLPINSRVYEDPRSKIVMRDAKAHFATAGTAWDLILSEPSNPWVSGVSGLFTEEFYRRVASALAPGGVFGQWLHTYELNDFLVLSVLSAIDRVFPDWVVHQVGGGDLLVIATRDSTLPTLKVDQLLEAPGLAADMCRFVPVSSASIVATRLANKALLGPVLDRIGQPNSDFYPTLDLGAERARFRRSSAAGMMSLGYDWFNLAKALDPTATRLRINIGPELAFKDIAGVRGGWVRDRVDQPEYSQDELIVNARRWTSLWTALTSTETSPADWRSWLDTHKAAMLVRHAGLAGIVDTAFFDASTRAAERLKAPEDVRAVLAFRRAVQEWDAAGALQHALMLRQAGHLLTSDELRDGTVVMALLAGNQEVAEEWFRYLNVTDRPDGDLRNLLLEARVMAEPDHSERSAP